MRPIVFHLLLTLSIGLAARGPAVAAGEPVLAPEVRAALEAEKAVVETIGKVVPAYVFIGGGSGVLISADGLMLTNNHVATSSQRWRVRVGSKFHHAEVLGMDKHGDITLLKIKDGKNLPFVEFADSDALVVGQQVIAIGNPFGTAEMTGEPTVTLGVISMLHRFQGTYSDAIQTDAAINPGNSGGPLLTLDGKLAGINGMITTKHGARANTGIGLAIPSVQIQRFLPLLKEAKGGVVNHGFIRGLEGISEESDGLQDGAELKVVRAGSPAEKLGFLPGDRITRVNEYAIRNFQRFQGVTGTYPSGTELKLKYVRAGKELSLSAKLETLAQGSIGAEYKAPRGPQDLVAPPAIEKVLEKSAAEKAGLKAGDIVLALNGKPVRNRLELEALLRAYERSPEFYAGEEFKVKFRRGGEEKEVTLILDSAYDRPATKKPAQGPHG